MDNENDVVRLPRQGKDMLDFLVAGITAAVQEGLDDRAIIETFHDYSCYWLSATEQDDTSVTLEVTNETNKRLN